MARRRGRRKQQQQHPAKSGPGGSGDGPGASEWDSSPTKEESAVVAPSSQSFWSYSPSSVIKAPARKISDVGAALKRNLFKQRDFGVSFRLNSTNEDEDGALEKGGGGTTMVDDEPSSYYLPPCGPAIRPVPSANTLNRLERQDIVLWRRPLRTLQFFVLELACLICEYTLKLWSNRRYVFGPVAALVMAYFAYNLPGPQQAVFRYLEKKLVWSAYWVGLGVLSSVGLGTGLHTFLLYLGPHIASVTLAAYECHSLKFPEPPYPDQIICPMSAHPNASQPIDQRSSSSSESSSEALALTSLAAAISLWQIMYKVALESFMWGAGTALGELPPYFMARAARLSGQEPDDEEYQEYIHYIRSSERTDDQSLLTRGKIFVEKLVEYAGFWGILACASIPNPFFDLAGITCGHFLVPFATFFLATLIGKAIIKMTIQQVFIILAFSEHHVEALVARMRYIPIIGSSLQTPFKDYLKQQKTKLHRKPGDPVGHKSNVLGRLFDMIVVVMVGFFVLSLVNSLAQNYHRRQWEASKRRRSLPDVQGENEKSM